MPPRHNPLTDEDRKLLQSVVADGGTRADAARELGVKFHVVKIFAPRMGVRFRKGNQRNPDKRAVVMSLVGAGLSSTRRIGRHMGVSHTLVHRWVQELVTDGLLRVIGLGSRSRIELTAEWEDRGELCRRKKSSPSSPRPRSRVKLR